MKNQIPKNLLFQLRNHIPIDELISHFLNIPCKHSEGHLRFLCPSCNEFRTAVNKKTNLARCFLCQRNYNPIDLVIALHNVRFLTAVNFLKPLLAEYQLRKHSLK